MSNKSIDEGPSKATLGTSSVKISQSAQKAGLSTSAGQEIGPSAPVSAMRHRGGSSEPKKRPSWRIRAPPEGYPFTELDWSGSAKQTQKTASSPAVREKNRQAPVPYSGEPSSEERVSRVTAGGTTLHGRRGSAETRSHSRSPSESHERDADRRARQRRSFPERIKSGLKGLFKRDLDSEEGVTKIKETHWTDGSY